MASNVSSFLRVIPNDMGRDPRDVLNGFVAFLTSGNPNQDVKLQPVVATKIKTSEVFFSPAFRAYFQQQQMDEEALKAFFLERHVTHIQQFGEIASKASEGFKDSTMLSVISSAHMEKQEPPHEIPGELYHQDGRGNALSVKITLTTKRVWEQGQLNIIAPKEGETPAGKKHSEIAPDAAPRLEDPGQAFLLNNKELYHAVVTPYISNAAEGPESANRTIYQERLNKNEGLNPALLEPFISK